MALTVGLQHAATLGGVVSLSGYLPVAAHFKPSAGNAHTPVFLGHGTDDTVVAVDWGRSTLAALKAAGVTGAALHEYEGLEHSVADEEVRDLLAFLERCLTAKPRI